jgi:hypothetical protein
VVALVLVGAGAVYGLSERRLQSHFTPPAHPLVVRSDSATVERGRYLANTRGCTECHGREPGRERDDRRPGVRAPRRPEPHAGGAPRR